MQTKSTLGKKGLCLPSWWMRKSIKAHLCLLSGTSYLNESVPINLKNSPAHWSFCRHPCIYSTFSPSQPLWHSGVQLVELPQLHSCAGEVPGSTSPQTIPFFHRPLASSSPSVTSLRSENYTGYHQTIFCSRHCSGKDCAPFACCTFILNPSIFHKLALRKVSTKQQSSFDENARSKNISMFANEP